MEKLGQSNNINVSIEVDEYAQSISELLLQADEPVHLNYYLRGQYAITFGKYHEGIKILHTALEFIENNPTKSNNLIDYADSHLPVSICSLIASSYDYLGNYDLAEKFYDKSMTLNPIGPHIGEYAVFLHRRKKEYDKALSFYKKALELYPSDSSIRLKYAGYLRHVKKDSKAAKEQYELACDYNPNYSDALGNYASFLHGETGDMELAEEYYEKALKVDELHANNLCNYGLFLSEEKKDYTKAERLYRRVLDTHPNHANTLYNYAVMLDTHCQRKGEAENLYRKCVLVEPQHAYGLYNLAVLLEEKIFVAMDRKKDTDLTTIKEGLNEVQSLYKRAISVDGNDPSTLADYGRFLLIKMEDSAAAESMLQKSLLLDGEGVVALFHLGLLQYRHKNDPSKAEELFRKVLRKHPLHVGALHHLARVLIDKCKRLNSFSDETSLSSLLEECLGFFEKAITASDEPTVAITEYLHSVIKYGSAVQQSRCVAFVDPIVQNLMKNKPSSQLAVVAESISKIKDCLSGIGKGA